jgi:YegS/Rv2252/BmrU family lipid kinase
LARSTWAAVTPNAAATAGTGTLRLRPIGTTARCYRHRPDYHDRVRGLLIANTNASTVTPRKMWVIERALSSEMKLEVVLTKRKEHATHLARGAAHEGLDLVIALGGDGTVNEVVNGLAGTPVPLGILPGGGTNVLARSLGIPRDTIEATGHLIANLRGEPRRVPVGRADGRYFTFGCGMGLDGAIVRDVERRQTLKKTAGDWYYVWSGFRVFAAVDRKKPMVTVRWGEDLEHRRDGMFLAICQKSSPFTYLGRRELRICPDARLDLGLDCLALDRFDTRFVLRIVAQVFGSARHTRNRHVLYLHDEQRIEVTSREPLPVEMDGEFIGERDRLLIETVPDALSLLY